MNIYLISQSTNYDYDSYDSAVVIAPDEKVAATIHPSTWSGKITHIPTGDSRYWDWVNDPALVSVELIGTTEADELRVVCSSFNAG